MRTKHLLISLVVILSVSGSLAASRKKIIRMTLGKDASMFDYDYDGSVIDVDFQSERRQTDQGGVYTLIPESYQAYLPRFVTIGRTDDLPGDGFAVLYKGKRFIVLGSNNDSTTLRHELLLGHELGHHNCGHSIGIARENNC
jgi:hypothetical protein